MICTFAFTKKWPQTFFCLTQTPASGLHPPVKISGYHIHGNNLQINTDLKDIASNVKTQVSDPKPPAVHTDGTQDCSVLFLLHWYDI